ncbi:hypothetical protein J5N97_025013 [Dioscorea zingiberensis]|uniref:WAT1-related protein n=1 Tax=Dioscorea zingiberensis TaxID=325984 RepID=A0A9D5C7H9_9LILI|nr:hypothetical protein J5N97_025013 [Dioscorea zingiberensis]
MTGLTHSVLVLSWNAIYICNLCSCLPQHHSCSHFSDCLSFQVRDSQVEEQDEDGQGAWHHHVREWDNADDILQRDNIEQNLSYPGPISPPSTHHSRAQFSEMDTRLTGLDRRQLQLGLLVRSPNKARQVLCPLFQHYLNLLSQLPSSCHTMYSYSTFSIWVLTNKNEIFVVIFAGLVGSGFGFLAVSWCVQKRGPVSTTAFSPLIQIIVVGIDFFILHGPLYLGSVLGSALVIAGLYFLLWGKTEEAQRSPVKQAPEISEGQAQGQTNV